MRTRFASRPGTPGISSETAEAYLAALLGSGQSDAALLQIRRSQKWLDAARVYLEGFREAERRVLGRSQKGMEPVPDFRAFRARYFGERGITHPHMEPYAALVQDDSIRRAIVIGAPEYGRSTVLNVQNLAWQAAKESYQVSQGVDPESPLRGAVMSGNNELAERFGWQLTRYLTDPVFCGDMIADYGPFRKPGRESRWSASEIYFSWRSPAEKDPSCQFLGWGKALQSARLTWAILDDVDDPLNGPSERRKILRYLDQIVIPRLGKAGRLLYLCNRVDELDVAREIIERAEDGTWYAIVQPAHDDDGKSLWDRYTPEHFADIRRQLRNDRLYSLVYLAKPLGGESQDFPLALVQQARDPDRTIGQAAQGLPVICALDPATHGGAGVIAVAVDRSRGRRYVLEADWGTDRRAMGLRRWIEEYTLRYRPQAFAIETQSGFALLEDTAIIRFLADHDCRFLPMKTGTNKRSQDYGVSSLSKLFDADRTLCRLSIPWGDDESRRKMGPLIDQLASYHPDSRLASDLVIALWLVERAVADLRWDDSRSFFRRIVDPLMARRPGVYGPRPETPREMYGKLSQRTYG